MTPVADGAVGWAIGNSSVEYSSPFAAMVTGGYIGAVVSYVLVYLNVRRDNPRVDGEYDPIYFDRNPRRNAALNAFTLGLAPVFLPAVGTAVGHLIGRNPLPHSRRTTLLPPLPVVLRGGTRDRSPVWGVQLLRGSF